MKFLQSKRNRRILLFAGLLLIGVSAYVGYELYTYTVAMDKFGEAMVVLSKLADTFSDFQEALPDSTAVIDSTQVMTDSLMIK